MRIKFRFGWVPFIAAVIVIAISVALGQWQTRRAAEKEAIERTLTAREAMPPVPLNEAVPSPDEAEYRRVVVKGEFDRGWPIYLDNRPYQGRAGFYVLMPLKMAGSDRHVLVARGWIPRDIADRVKLPPLQTPAGMVEIQGVARRNPGRLLQLGKAEPLRPRAIVQNLDIADFAQAAALPMLPFLIEQQNDTGDGMVRDWPKPSSGVDKHRGYAFQWYALAAMAFVFFIVTGFRRART